MRFCVVFPLSSFINSFLQMLGRRDSSSPAVESSMNIKNQFETLSFSQEADPVEES